MVVETTGSVVVVRIHRVDVISIVHVVTVCVDVMRMLSSQGRSTCSDSRRVQRAHPEWAKEELFCLTQRLPRILSTKQFR